MSQSVKAIVLIVVAAVVLYGGYRLYRHYSKQPVAPVAMAPAKTPVASPTATPNSLYKMMSDSKGVSYLTDDKGMALYTYSKDKTGISNCSGTCIINWPAFGPKTEPTSLLTDITVITRTDKSLQYAWKGMPLYYFVKDLKAGDVTGDGVGGFTLAK
jgi:predicted lipoprotein with Yx(FWY)xxD motif